MKSIIMSNRKCWVCGSVNNLELHHVFFGTANRKLSDADGLTVWLCPEHHRGTNGVHGKNGHELDMALKRSAEYAWIQRYGSGGLERGIEEFRQRYGVNYLDID